MSPFDRV